MSNYILLHKLTLHDNYNIIHSYKVFNTITNKIEFITHHLHVIGSYIVREEIEYS